MQGVAKLCWVWGGVEEVNENAGVNGGFDGCEDWSKAARERRTPKGGVRWLILLCGGRIGVGDVSSKSAPF